MSAGFALAVLGDPLTHTRSPDLHRAGLASLGLAGESEALRTAPQALPERLHDLAARGYRGVNLTSPLKETVIPLLARVSDAASRARSVNTVGFESDGWWGDTTDGAGFVDLLASLGRDPAGQRAVFLGAGAAARSLALALTDAGSGPIVAVARDPEAARETWSEIEGSRLCGWGSRDGQRALLRATLVVRALPPGVEAGPDFSHLGAPTLCVDLSYGPDLTPWTLAARARGLEAYDGLGLLVFQARLSLALWFSRPVPVDPLARAVGWPR